MKMFRSISRIPGAFFLRIFLLAFLATGISMSAAQAQNARAPADIQKQFDEFIGKFRVALKANDADAVTGMTRFPFYWDEMRDAAHFRQNLYAKIFPPKIRNCLARTRSYYDRAQDGADIFTLICGEDLFLFTRTPAGFLFAEVGTKGG